MFKKTVTFLLILGLLLAILWATAGPPTPLPYGFKQQVKLLTAQQQEQAKESTLLIVGDRHGHYFSRYFPQLRKKLAPLFRNMKILNMAQDYHGIHRSLKKLQELPHLPSLVLFLGGYDEFYEQKFDLRQYAAIKKNFLTFQDDYNLVLMNLFPFLASLITQSLPRHWYGPSINPAKKYDSPLINKETWNYDLKCMNGKSNNLSTGLSKNKASSS